MVFYGMGLCRIFCGVDKEWCVDVFIINHEARANLIQHSLSENKSCQSKFLLRESESGDETCAEIVTKTMRRNQIRGSNDKHL